MLEVEATGQRGRRRRRFRRIRQMAARYATAISGRGHIVTPLNTLFTCTLL